MNRTLVLALITGLCLTGCRRSADPLDWRIQGSDPNELTRWLAENLPRMPRDLSTELAGCLVYIRADTFAGPGGKQKDHRLCRRIDGHTVREMLIEGHSLANDRLLAQITNQSDAVVRLLSTADTLTPEQLKKHEALMNSHLALQNSLKRRLKESENRVADLRAPAPEK